MLDSQIQAVQTDPEASAKYVHHYYWNQYPAISTDNIDKHIQSALSDNSDRTEKKSRLMAMTSALFWGAKTDSQCYEKCIDILIQCAQEDKALRNLLIRAKNFKIPSVFIMYCYPLTDKIDLVQNNQLCYENKRINLETLYLILERKLSKAVVANWQAHFDKDTPNVSQQNDCCIL